ncbi:UNVERIFIED_CONTAM: MarR family transcriptional regulator [Mumia flava]
MPRSATEPAVVAARDIVAVLSRLRRRLREVRDLSGLSPSQTAVLNRIDQDGPITSAGLAQAERVRPQSMAATVGVLLERGLVQRTPDPADGRRQLLSLSQHGRAWLDDRHRARDEWLVATLDDGLSAEELATVIEAVRLLERVAQS